MRTMMMKIKTKLAYKFLSIAVGTKGRLSPNWNIPFHIKIEIKSIFNLTLKIAAYFMFWKRIVSFSLSLFFSTFRKRFKSIKMLLENLLLFLLLWLFFTKTKKSICTNFLFHCYRQMSRRNLSWIKNHFLRRPERRL